MNTKQTAEGHIFHCEGEMERCMVRRILTSASSNSPLAKQMLSRLEDGGGAFCVFQSELSEFRSVLDGMGGGGFLGDSGGGVISEMERDLKDSVGINAITD